MADLKILKILEIQNLCASAILQCGAHPNGGQIGARQSGSQNKRVKAPSSLGLK